MAIRKFISIESLFPRLYQVIPGWLPGVIHSVTAGTGVGKTKFVKYAFLLHSYRYCKENNIPFYCIWFALEEDKDVFWTSMLLDLLQEKHGITLSYYQVKGYHSGLTPDIQELINELLPEIDEMKKVISVVDTVSNPTGIYKTILEFVKPLGIKEDGILDQDEYGNQWSSYEFHYHNPQTQVMVVIDHMTLITPEKNKYNDASTKHLAITKMSEYFIKFIAKKIKAIPVIIHQQEASSGNVDDLKMGRAEPTLDKLGVNKLVQQEYEVVLGLFNPLACVPPIRQYGGYNTDRFGSHFRSLSILKHRKGESGKRLGLYFHGATNKYEELPSPTSPEISSFYQ